MAHNALFLVNSVYQLLTVVHLKRTLLGDREADLLLTDVTPALPRLRGRGRKSVLRHRPLQPGTRRPGALFPVRGVSMRPV